MWGSCHTTLCVANGEVSHPFHFISAALMPVEFCCQLVRASRSLICHGRAMVTTLCFILSPFSSSIPSSWHSAVSLAAKAVAEYSVSPVFCLVGLCPQWMLLPVMPSRCLISLWVQAWKQAVPLRQSRQGDKHVVWHECPIASALLRLSVCKEFGKEACIYTGIYLNQIQILSPIACAVKAAIERQTFLVTLTAVTIFNAAALT